MARNIHAPAFPYDSHAQPSTSLQHEQVDYGTMQDICHHRCDDDRILSDLTILGTHKIPLEILLLLIEEPCRTACINLLKQADRGLNPLYIASVLRSLDFGSDAVRPDENRNSYHSRVTRELQGPSWVTFDSTFSGDTLRNSPDAQTPFDESAQDLNLSSNLQIQLPYRSIDHTMHDGNSCHESRPSCRESMYYVQVDDASRPVLGQDLQQQKTFAIAYHPTSDTASAVSLTFPKLSPQSLDDPFSTTLSPYISLEDTGTPLSLHLTPQSSVNESLYNAAASSIVQNNAFSTAQSTPSSVNPTSACKSMDIKHYSKPPPKKYAYRSPCPYCTKNFVSLPEFVRHITTEHEQPMEFICRCPYTQDRHCFETTSESQMKRHHTLKHADFCKTFSTCYKKIPKSHPKQIWGCWFCNWTENTIEEWASHHMKHHEGYRRGQMSFTWLVKSLLSQKSTTHWWQQLINETLKNTGQEWDFQWYNDNTKALALVEALECGFCNDNDLSSAEVYPRELTMAIMDQAVLKSIPSGIKRAATASPPTPKAHKSCIPRTLPRQSSKGTVSRLFTTGAMEAATQSDMKEATMRHTRPYVRANHKQNVGGSANSQIKTIGVSFGN